MDVMSEHLRSYGAQDWPAMRWLGWGVSSGGGPAAAVDGGLIMASMPLPAGSGDGGPGEHRSLIELTTDDPAWHNPPSPMMVSPSQTAPCGPGPGAAGAAGAPGLTAGDPG